MKRILTIAIAALAFNAHAEFMSGNDLYERMTSDNTIRQSMALGYVIGAHDALREVTHCSPMDVTAGQVRDMVKAWLQANPAQRHISAASITSHVLKSVWPCQRGSNSSL